MAIKSGKHLRVYSRGESKTEWKYTPMYGPESYTINDIMETIPRKHEIQKLKDQYLTSPILRANVMAGGVSIIPEYIKLSLPELSKKYQRLVAELEYDITILAKPFDLRVFVHYGTPSNPHYATGTLYRAINFIFEGQSCCVCLDIDTTYLTRWRDISLSQWLLGRAINEIQNHTKTNNFLFHKDK